MNKILKYKNLFALFFLGFVFLSTSFLNKSYAQTTTYEADIYFCSSDGNTIWGVEAKYLTSAGILVGSIPANSWTNSTSDISSPYVCNSSVTGATGYTGIYSTSDTKPDPNNTVTWHTACVDPEISVYLRYQPGTNNMGQPAYTAKVDVTCPPGNSITNSDGSTYPASCNGASNSGKQIAADTWCPFGPYCMDAGLVANNNLGSSNLGYCPGAFFQNQIVGTIPSSCGYGGTCNYSYCNTGSLTCSSTTDTTGARCGAACAGSTATCPSGTSCTTSDACAGTCSSDGATCIKNNSACPSPAPAPGCSPAPKYSPPKDQPATDTANTPCDTSATSCQTPCSLTCANGCQATCNTVWACQSTQWYNSGTYYATCPTSCTTNCSAPGMTRTTCSAANACLVP